MYKKTIIPDRLKEAYDLQLLREGTVITRFFCFLALAITMPSIFIDIWALPSTFVETNVVKSILVVVDFFVLWMICQSKLARYHLYFQHILFLAPAFSVVCILHISNPADTGHYIYASFLVMIIMMFFSWSTLSIRALMINTALIFLSYTLSTFIHVGHDVDFSHNLAGYIPTVFVMLGAVIVGYYGKKINESNSRQNFIYKHTLEESLQAQKYIANHDALTGLSNRRDADQFFDNDIRYAKKHKAVHFVMLLDLNGFKAINDEYGHSAGDEVLKVVSKRLKSCLRRGDSISRIGGDEFAISIVLNKCDNYCINQISNKIQQHVLQPIAINDVEVSVGTSVGVASFPNDADNFEDLLKIADQRMYDHKRMNSTRNKAQKSNRDTTGIEDSTVTKNDWDQNLIKG